MALSGAFTRTELTIAVVGIAGWVTLALPGYADYVTRTRFTEAHIVLGDLRSGMKRHVEQASSYLGGPCAPTGRSGEQVRYFDFSCTPGEPTTKTFTLLAVGKTGTDIEGLTYSLNQSGVRTTTIAPGSSMADQGYTGHPTCWVRRRPGRCTN